MSKGEPGITVARPRILEARRAELGTFSVGDEAVVEFAPGMLRFLSLRDSTGVAIGEGCAPEWTLAASAATAAALAVVEPSGFEDMNTWTGVTHRVRWVRACRPDETLIAACRLVALTRAATLPSRVFSRERGDVVAETEIVLVSVANDADGNYAIDPRRSPASPIGARTKPPNPDRPVYASAPGMPGDAEVAVVDWRALPVWSAHAPAVLEATEGPADELFALRSPRLLRTSAAAGVTGAIWEWYFPCDLLRLLAHPVAGGRDPLGRRCHPYGLLLEGMAVHAAQAITAGGEPRRLETLWHAPIRGKDDFRIRSTLGTGRDGTAGSVQEVFEGERAVATVRVEIDHRHRTLEKHAS